jgi:L-lactate utilization protein LutB
MIANRRLTTEQYQENFADIHPPFDNREGAIIEANRCIMCYDAPCIKMCPTHINIPKFIKQIATDNVKGSARTILRIILWEQAVPKFVLWRNYVKALVFITFFTKNRFR